MIEKARDDVGDPTSEMRPARPDDYGVFAENYLAYIASAMYHFAQGDGDAFRDIKLARYDTHGNLSEDEFET